MERYIRKQCQNQAESRLNWRKKWIYLQFKYTDIRSLADAVGWLFSFTILWHLRWCHSSNNANAVDTVSSVRLADKRLVHRERHTLTHNHLHKRVHIRSLHSLPDIILLFVPKFHLRLFLLFLLSYIYNFIAVYYADFPFSNILLCNAKEEERIMAKEAMR